MFPPGTTGIVYDNGAKKCTLKVLRPFVPKAQIDVHSVSYHPKLHDFVEKLAEK